MSEREGKKLSATFFLTALFSIMLVSCVQAAEYGKSNYGSSAYGGGANPADLNGDGRVDIFDLTLVTSHFGLSSSSAGWDASADVAANGEIDIYDVVFVASRFN
jgi:hypothetical protein